MQLLWLLLSPDQDVSFAELSELLSSEGAPARTGGSLFPVSWSACSKHWDAILANLTLSPRCLRTCAETEEGRELIGPDFDAIWEALWTVRGSAQMTSRADRWLWR